MRQLLGMNCSTPTDVIFSFEGFHRRDGIIDHRADDFGVGLFEGRGVRLFHDNKPSASSPVADLVRVYQIKSENVIAHIRKASQEQTSLTNTCPFMRGIRGEYWLFIHNGHLIDFYPEQGGYCHAVGATDSKRVFCYILNRLCNRFTAKSDAGALSNAIATLTHEICRYELLNFVMSNGNCLLTRTSTLLHYIMHKAPFGKTRFLDGDVTVDLAEITTPNGKVAVTATLPLTRDKTWSQLAIDGLVMFCNGDIVRSGKPKSPVYMSTEEGLEITHAAGVAV